MQMNLFAKAPTPRHAALAPAIDEAEEAAAASLEDGGQFRILRRLRHRDVVSDASRADRRIGVIIDTETTGFDPERCEVIEFAAVAFTYNAAGIHDVVGEFEALQEPRGRLPAEVTRVTGLTNDDLAGRRIDMDALADFMRPVDLVIAHNARFDRPFCEKLHPLFQTMTWGCSVSDVDWPGFGESSARLSHLLASVGRFHDAHRALTDSHAVLEILTAERYSGPSGAFAQILGATQTEFLEIRAEAAPYSERSILKNRGYRWDPGSLNRAKAWTLTVPAEKADAEIHFLRHAVYKGFGLPVVNRIAPQCRFK